MLVLSPACATITVLADTLNFFDADSLRKIQCFDCWLVSGVVWLIAVSCTVMKHLPDCGWTMPNNMSKGRTHHVDSFFIPNNMMPMASTNAWAQEIHCFHFSLNSRDCLLSMAVKHKTNNAAATGFDPLPVLFCFRCKESFIHNNKTAGLLFEWSKRCWEIRFFVSF